MATLRRSERDAGMASLAFVVEGDRGASRAIVTPW
jgi:hypothetical protein